LGSQWSVRATMETVALKDNSAIYIEATKTCVVTTKFAFTQL